MRDASAHLPAHVSLIPSPVGELLYTILYFVVMTEALKKVFYLLGTVVVN